MPPYKPLRTSLVYPTVNKVFVLSTVKTLLVLALILSGWIHLSPDEAQYWTWSRVPDFGYYSKPPGIAYQIAFGTALFGNSELGVRFGSLLIGFLMPFLIYKLSRAATLSDKEAFWAAFLWILSPLGFMGSFFAITDVGLIFFWTLALYFLVKEGVSLKFGLMIALGAVFKFPIYFLWPLAIFYERPSRNWIKPLLLSLLGLIPTLIWNLENHFVTFRHVGATLPGGSNAILSGGNALSFVGSQIALFSPIFFILLILSFRVTTPHPIRFLGLSSLLILTLSTLLSLFTKLQGNWIDYAYPALCPYIAYATLNRLSRPKDWLFYGGALSLFLITLSFLLPYKQSPYKHNLGWDRLAYALEEAGYDPDRQFLFADSYQTTALLSFYAPRQTLAHFLNLRGIRNNQYSLWPLPNPHSEGLYVLIDDGSSNPADLIKLLKPYFGLVRLKGTYPLIANKQAMIIQALDYNGKAPDASERY